MKLPARRSWDPDRRWADPLILFLAFLAVVLSLHLPTRPQATSPGIHPTGRVLELQAAAQDWLGYRTPFPTTPRLPLTDWDRALVAVLLAEAGDRDRGQALALQGPPLAGPGASFQRAWLAAYQGQVPPSPSERRAVFQALGGGWAAHHLEARLHPEPERSRYVDAARSWARPRLFLFAGITLAGITATLVGLIALPLLVGTARRPHPDLPHWELSGRALLLVFLLWFVVLRCSGTLAFLVLGPMGVPRAWLLPVAFLIHATFGLALLAWAEGRPLRLVLAPLTRSRWSHTLGWAGTFLAAALPMVLAAGWLAHRILGPGDPPQRELRDLIGTAQGWGITLLLFLTVAVLAPIFEEILFRGCLLPWLQTRIHGRWPSVLAVLGTGLAFGAMHLQPRGLPVLATLGGMLGWALVRSGDLRAAILIHGAWNGGVFLLMKTLA